MIFLPLLDSDERQQAGGQGHRGQTSPAGIESGTWMDTGLPAKRGIILCERTYNGCAD